MSEVYVFNGGIKCFYFFIWVYILILYYMGVYIDFVFKYIVFYILLIKMVYFFFKVFILISLFI